MSYIKPQLTPMTSAANAIQGDPQANKSFPFLLDNNFWDPLYGTLSATSAAYQADE